MSDIKEPSAKNNFLDEHARLLASSYSRLTGKKLFNVEIACEEFPRALFEAPFGLISHNTDPVPVFNYANLTAMSAFEMEWTTIIGLASRDSAESTNQEERELLMARVKEEGFIENYRGIRVSASGRRFWIERTTIWNVLDDSDNYKGQAAAFHLE